MSYNITLVDIKLMIFFAQNCKLNFRQAFQVSLWNHRLYCLYISVYFLYMVFFPSIAFNQLLKRKFAKCVITKPFTFWRKFSLQFWAKKSLILYLRVLYHNLELFFSYIFLEKHTLISNNYRSKNLWYNNYCVV